MTTPQRRASVAPTPHYFISLSILSIADLRGFDIYSFDEDALMAIGENGTHLGAASF